MNAIAVAALSKRIRKLVAGSAHRSELLETCDLLDVALEAPAPQDLAPAPSPTEQTPPAPIPTSAVEEAGQPSGEKGACALPSGWSAHCEYVAGCFQHEGGNARVQGDGKHEGTWWWQTGPGAVVKHAPTMLTAMAAALGIRLERRRTGAHDAGPWSAAAWLDNGEGETLVALGPFYDGSKPSLDEVARAALEAFHARQLAAPDLAAIADAVRALETPPPPRNMPLATMKPSWDSPPPSITRDRLLELAAEALKAASKARSAALEAEGWAARVRAACGGER